MAPKRKQQKKKKEEGPTKAETTLRKAAQATLEHGHQQTLDELMTWLSAHPGEASSILASIRAKAWDQGPSDDEEEQDKLPPYMNKLKTIPKGKLLEYIGWLVPHVSQWIKSLEGRKMKMDDLVHVLAFLTHMGPSSALTTKRESKLKKDFAERWSLNGKRADGWQPTGSSIQARILCFLFLDAFGHIISIAWSATASLWQDFWTSNGYWALEMDVDYEEGYLVYKGTETGDEDENRVALPEDMLSKDTIVTEVHLFDGAVIKKGALMRGVAHLLSELGAANKWERPLYLKDVPGDCATDTKVLPKKDKDKTHSKDKKKKKHGSSSESGSGKSKVYKTLKRRLRKKCSDASSPFSETAAKASHSKASPSWKNEKASKNDKTATRGPSPTKKATPPKGKGSVLIDD